MTDTSLMFSVLGRERVGAALARVASLFRSAGQEAERATRQAKTSTERLDGQIHEVQRSLAELNAEFAATGNKELFVKMKRDRSLLSQLQSVRREIGAANDEVDRLGENDRASSMLARLGRGATDAGDALQSGLASAAQMVTSNAWLLVGAAGALVAGLSAISPAAFLAGGALGSLPAIMAGVTAAFSVVKLGSIGLAEQWKAQTTATGGAARAAVDLTAKHRAVEQAARQVSRAERDVTAAQKAAKDATLAVAAAVAEETRRRRDLATDAATAAIDVKDAVAARTQAETDLNAAQANGETPERIDELQRAYDRAQIAVTTATNRVSDLGEEQKKAAATGVQGSDLVVAAREREKQAIQRVKDAQDAQRESVERLKDAQKALNAPQGGGGGGGIVPPKIAASAQKFLDVLKQLKPAFEALRLDVQQRLFAGLGDKLKVMATAWLPQLDTSLGKMADTFNRVIGKFMDTASQPSFIKNIGTGVESFRGALEKVGVVAAGPLTTAFGNLSAAAAPFIKALGDEAAKALGSFSRWINRLAEGGENSRLNKFFQTAADVLKDVFKVLKDVGSVIGGVLKAVFHQPESGLGPWKSFVKAMDSVGAWFADSKNQQKISDWITKVQTWGGEIVGFFKKIGPEVGAAVAFVGVAAQTSGAFINTVVGYTNGLITAFKWLWKNAPKAWAAVKDAFGTAKDWVVKKGGELVGWVRGLPKKIASAASGMWNGLRDSFRSAINWIIGRWNNLSFSLPSVTIPLLGTIGGGRLDTPNIPYLAKGGTAVRDGLAVVGDRGPELLSMQRGASVIPLDRAGGGGPIEIRVSIAPGADSPVMRALVTQLRYEVSRNGRGSVQKFLGAKGVTA